MRRYEGKVAIVTGGASGIGAATAVRLGEEGAAVVVADLQLDPAREVAAGISKAGGRAIAVAADVTDESAVGALVDRAVSEFGRLDLMVNNAGIGEESVPIEQKDAAAWHKVIATNLDSAFYGVKHAARVMKAADHPGVIINMASILGVVGFRGAPAYTAAKHGMIGLTRAAALELAPAGIRVVAVDPAFIRTPLISGMEDAVLPLHPIGRLGTAEEVAGLVAYLGSDEAGFLTGASYLIDGGYTAQ